MRGEPAALTLRRAACAAIEAQARAEAPRECCGVLLGQPTGSSGSPAAGRSVDTVAILEAIPVTNIAPAADRFLLDPKGHIDARREARRRGLAVVGFYHSHPHSAPQPSRVDVAEADYDGLYLIVGIAAPAAQFRLFRRQAGIFLELPFVTVG